MFFQCSFKLTLVTHERLKVCSKVLFGRCWFEYWRPSKREEKRQSKKQHYLTDNYLHSLFLFWSSRRQRSRRERWKKIINEISTQMFDVLLWVFRKENLALVCYYIISRFDLQILFIFAKYYYYGTSFSVRRL